MNDKQTDPKIRHLNPETKQQQKDWLMKQIPVVGETESVVLPKQFYKRLTDDQFKMLVTEVELNMMVGAKTAEYIKRRMRRQGIRHQDHMQKQQKPQDNEKTD